LAQKTHKLFDKVAWSYMPANLDGCLVTGVFAVVLVAIVSGGLLISRALDSAFLEIATWIVAATAFIAFLRFSKRHS
jgi:hypothetical protein